MKVKWAVKEIAVIHKEQPIKTNTYADKDFSFDHTINYSQLFF